jgi:hypothetical protein
MNQTPYPINLNLDLDLDPDLLFPRARVLARARALAYCIPKHRQTMPYTKKHPKDTLAFYKLGRAGEASSKAILPLCDLCASVFRLGWTFF